MRPSTEGVRLVDKPVGGPPPFTLAVGVGVSGPEKSGLWSATAPRRFLRGEDMRVNVYAEEMTDRVELVTKMIDGEEFTGVRFYLYLPVSEVGKEDPDVLIHQHRGPFLHRMDDDDSAAVTFWGKRSLRVALQKALDLLTAQAPPADYLAVAVEKEAAYIEQNILNRDEQNALASRLRFAHNAHSDSAEPVSEPLAKKAPPAGKIVDVREFDHALSPEEIKHLYDAPETPLRVAAERVLPFLRAMAEAGVIVAHKPSKCTEIADALEAALSSSPVSDDVGRLVEAADRLLHTKNGGGDASLARKKLRQALAHYRRPDEPGVEGEA